MYKRVSVTTSSPTNKNQHDRRVSDLHMQYLIFNIQHPAWRSCSFSATDDGFAIEELRYHSLQSKQRTLKPLLAMRHPSQSPSPIECTVEVTDLYPPTPLVDFWPNNCRIP